MWTSGRWWCPSATRLCRLVPEKHAKLPRGVAMQKDRRSATSIVDHYTQAMQAAMRRAVDELARRLRL